MKFFRICLLTFSIINFNHIFPRINGVSANSGLSNESITVDEPEEATEPQQANSDTTIDTTNTIHPNFVSNNGSGINTTVLFPVSKGNTFNTFKCYILNPVVGTLGMVLNGIGLVVLSKLDDYRAFHYFLSALLILDEIHLAAGIGGCVPQYIQPYGTPFANNYVATYTEPICNTLILTVFCIYIYMISLMSLERCFVIKFPLKRRHNPKKLCLSFLLITALLSIGLHSTAIVSLISGDVKEYFDKSTNQTRYVTVNAEVGGAFKFSFGLFHILVTKVIPVLVVIPCNIFICVMLSMHRRKRATLFASSVNASQQTEQIRMTLTLTAISFVLFMSVLPLSVGFFGTFFYPDRFAPGKQDHFIMKILSDVSFAMQTFSASTDFLTYICISKKTWDIFKSMFIKN